MVALKYVEEDLDFENTSFVRYCEELLYPWEDLMNRLDAEDEKITSKMTQDEKTEYDKTKYNVERDTKIVRQYPQRDIFDLVTGAKICLAAFSHVLKATQAEPGRSDKSWTERWETIVDPGGQAERTSDSNKWLTHQATQDIMEGRAKSKLRWESTRRFTDGTFYGSAWKAKDVVSKLKPLKEELKLHGVDFQEGELKQKYEAVIQALEYFPRQIEPPKDLQIEPAKPGGESGA